MAHIRIYGVCHHVHYMAVFLPFVASERGTRGAGGGGADRRAADRRVAQGHGGPPSGGNRGTAGTHGRKEAEGVADLGRADASFGGALGRTSPIGFQSYRSFGGTGGPGCQEGLNTF